MQKITIIDHFDIQALPKQGIPLSHKLITSILTNPLSKDSQEYLKRMYDDKKWLLCECTPYSPISVKYIRGDNTFRLCKVPHRNHHSESCSFFKIETKKMVEAKPSNKAIAGGTNHLNYKLDYDFNYRKSFDIDNLQVVPSDDRLATFILTLVDSYKIDVNQSSQNKASMKLDNLETRTLQFMLNKVGLRERFSHGHLGDYIKFKNKLSELIDGGEKYPVGLHLMHINSFSLKGHRVLTVGDGVKAKNITIPKFTPVTSLVDSAFLTSPIIAALIVGKTGTNKQTNKPMIGPLHVLLLPSLNYNDYSVVFGKSTRMLLRIIYSLSKTTSSVRMITVKSHTYSNDLESVSLSFADSELTIIFSESRPSTVIANSINIWINTTNLSLKELHTPLNDIVRGISTHTLSNTINNFNFINKI